MKNRVAIMSVLAVMFASPVLAEPSHTSETFPNDGKMQEDYRYLNQAVYDNILVYSGSVDANALYTDINYTVNAGQYLPALAEAVTDCTSGNYCPGLQNPVQYSSTINQGLNACPTGFGTSAVGSTVETDCYRTCDIANVGTSVTEIPHAATLSGNDYYGAGTDTCEPATCQNGYTLDSGVVDLMTAIGTTEIGTGYAYVSHYGTPYVEEGGTLPATYGISAADEFGVDYGSNKGRLKGRTRCSTQAGRGYWTSPAATTYSEVTTSDDVTENFSTGQACWCKIESYTAPNGVEKSLVTSWVFLYETSGCADKCAYNCARVLYTNNSEQDRGFRAAVLSSLGISAPFCDANVITINWENASSADISANNAGTCTYGEDLKTPVKAQHIPGKTFVGWTLETVSEP